MASQIPNSTHLKPHFRLPAMNSLTLNSAHTKQHFGSRPPRKVRIIAKFRGFLDPEIESSDRVSRPRVFVQKPNGESSDNVTILLGDQMERSRSRLWARRRLVSASAMLNLFSPWRSGSNSDKVELTVAELESLRSEIVAAEEREKFI